MAGVGALCSLPALIEALPVSAPDLTPDRLRALVLAADGPYAGYAESQGALGLPDLPELGEVASLLGSRTRLRVWDGGGQRWRVDVLSHTGEVGRYGYGAGTVVWDYERNLVLDLIGDPQPRLPRARDLVPAELGARLLGAELGPEELSPLPARRVAGVAAAGVRITPADPDTTVGTVDIWADPVTGRAVEVRITARGAQRADLVTRFLDLEQGAAAVPAEVLDPPTPPGAERVRAEARRVSDLVDTAAGWPLPDRLAGLDRTDLTTQVTPGVGGYGTGYSALVAVTLPGGVGVGAFRAAVNAGGQVEVGDAGRTVLVGTPLLNVVVAVPHFGPQAYLVAGLLSVERVHEAAEDLLRSPPAPGGLS